jgi:nifR3 family TIM-barrel protein
MGSLKIGHLELGQGLILAPMAGITDLSLRKIALSFGADLVTTEMVSAEGLVRGNQSTRVLLQRHPEERPLAIQLFGSNPVVMAEAARLVALQGPDLIDLNMGCPVAKVVRQGAGAALLRNLETVSRVVEAVRAAVRLPLSVKIRSGWDRSEISAVEVGRAAEAAGADAITVHPRTARQGFSGRADWDLIGEVKQALTIPVIGNGDVFRPEQVAEMRQVTGCDGVMVGRGAMGNPWIFKQAKQLAAGQSWCQPSAQERLETMLQHLVLYGEVHRGRPPLSGLRSRLMWYTRGLRGSARLRAALSQARQPETMIKCCEDFFQSQSYDTGTAGSDLH